MKKLIMAFVAAGAVATACAQTKTTYGISGGVNFAKVQVTQASSNLSANTGTLTSFSIGVFADAPVGSNNISIQPGLYYTGKGGSVSSNDITYTSKIYYLQVPVNVVYNVPFSAGKVFFGVGPYAAVAINGKNQISGSMTGGTTISEDIEFGDGANASYKRPDFGLTGLLGLTFKNGLLLKVSYDLGLINTAANNASGEKNKNMLVGISAGFNF